MNYIYVHEGSLPSYIVKSLENTLKQKLKAGKIY